MLKSLKKAILGRFASVQDRLEFNIEISNKIIALGIFALILKDKLELDAFFGCADVNKCIIRVIGTGALDNLPNFVSAKGQSLVVALCTVIWFFQYRSAVANEMRIVVRLFSAFNPPPNWKSIVGYNMVPILSIGLTLCFIALAYSIDRIPLYCSIVFLLNLFDIRGNNMLRQTLIKHFDDERYLPAEADLHRPFIMRRREVATEYWLRRPQLERIALVMIGNSIALQLTLSDAIIGVPLNPWFGIIALVVTIFANEWVMRSWRRDRNRALDKIDDDETAANRARARDLPPAAQAVTEAVSPAVDPASAASAMPDRA